MRYNYTCTRRVSVGEIYELEFCSAEIYPDLQISIKEDFIGVKRERGGPSYVDWSKILSPFCAEIHE